MVNVDSSIFIQIFNFILLIWLLNIILFKPIRSMISQRKESIGSIEKRIIELNNSIETNKEKYKRQIDEINENAKRQKLDIIQTAENEGISKLKAIAKKGQEEYNKQKELLHRNIEKTKEEIKNDIQLFANNIFQKMLGRAA